MLNLEQEIVVASVESGHCYLRCSDHIIVAPRLNREFGRRARKSTTLAEPKADELMSVPILAHIVYHPYRGCHSSDEEGSAEDV